MNLDAIHGWIAVASSVGVIPALLWFARWSWVRLSWVRFEELIDAWARGSFVNSQLTPEDWRSLCAMKLSEEFGPSEVSEHLDLAVLVAKRRTSLILSGEISKAV